MARPRTQSDDDLLSTIETALAARPAMAPWGLRDIAPTAGMSPAGLLRRFGSKEQLLLALTHRWIERIPERSTRQGQESAELRAYLNENFAASSSAAARAGLGALLRDLGSPASAPLLRDGWSKQARYLSALLAQMALRPEVHPDRAALTLLDALHGGLFRQAVALEPTSPDRTLDTLLEGWT